MYDIEYQHFTSAAYSTSSKRGGASQLDLNQILTVDREAVANVATAIPRTLRSNIFGRRKDSVPFEKSFGTIGLA